MTISDTYNYLLRVRSLERTIWRLTLQRDELQSCLLPSAIRYDKDVVQVSPEDKLSEIASTVLELDKHIRNLQEQKARTIMETTDAIDQLQDERERTILAAFFIGRVSIEKIGKTMGYSPSHVYTLRRRGVKHLAAML